MELVSDRGPLTWTQAAQTVFGLLPYTDKKDMYSLTDVMGLSSHAFRITIHRETVSPAGPTVYSPYELMGVPLELMGFKVKQIYVPVPATPEQLETYIAFVQESIDRGMPVTGWDMFVPEFGIIYGYDNEKQQLSVWDVEKNGTIAYDQLNQRRYGCLHSLSITESHPVEPLPMLLQALQRNLEFCRGVRQKPDDDFRHGLEGYEAWILAFSTRTVHIPGNAYNLAVVADARQFAVAFFRGFVARWLQGTLLAEGLAGLADQAAAHYSQVAEALSLMRERFPFPHGGEPNDPLEAEFAIRQLRTALEAEREGVAVMEQMVHILSDYLNG